MRHDFAIGETVYYVVGDERGSQYSHSHCHCVGLYNPRQEVLAGHSGERL